MHMLAKNSAEKLSQGLEKKPAWISMANPSTTVTFSWVWWKVAFFTLEEFIEDEVLKYINNDGFICGPDSDVQQAAEPCPLFKWSF